MSDVLEKFVLRATHVGSEFVTVHVLTGERGFNAGSITLTRDELLALYLYLKHGSPRIVFNIVGLEVANNMFESNIIGPTKDFYPNAS